MRHLGEGQCSSQLYLTSSGMGTEGTVLSAKPYSGNSQYGSALEGMRQMTAPWTTVPQQLEAVPMLTVQGHLPMAMASHVGYELSCQAFGWQMPTGCHAGVGMIAGCEQG